MDMLHDGTTMLMLESAHGDIDRVQYYMQEGEDINNTNEDGETALMWAALYGHENIVKLLLAKGADPLVKDIEGQTALDCARLAHHKNNNARVTIIELLTRQQAGFMPKVNTALKMHLG